MDALVVNRDIALEAAVNGVVLQEVGIRLRIAQVVDRHDLQRIAVVLVDDLEDLPPNAAEPVDCDPCWHRFPPLWLSAISYQLSVVNARSSVMCASGSDPALH